MREWEVSATINVGLGTSTQSSIRGLQDPEEPFRILIIGDFGAERDGSPLQIDPDTLEDAPSRVGSQVELAVAGERIKIAIESLEDLHPDSLYQKLPLFRALRGLRSRLENPDTFLAAAAELSPPVQPLPQPPPTIATDLSALDMILAAANPPVTVSRPALASDPWQEIIRGIVAPHLQPLPDPRQKDLIAEVDRTASELMRSILHSPGFQGVEAAWRAVDFLLRRVETGADLTIHVANVRRDDLEVRLPNLLGLESWTVVAGLYTFAPDESDVAVLSTVAEIAEDCCVPFLAAASPRFVGCVSFGETPDPDDWLDPESPEGWPGLRTSAVAQWLGLAAPRFLLRLPYGSATSASDFFAFEEMPGKPVHEDYLWGNPAVAGVCLLAQAFARDGHEMRAGSINRLTELPVHVVGRGADAKMTPCAEFWMSEDTASRMLGCGLMPLVSIKNQNVVFWPWFASIVDPPTSLRGRWRNDVD